MALQDFGSLSFSTPEPGAKPAGRDGHTTGLDAATVDRIVAEEGAGALKPTVLGIYGQESGGGTNARTSTDGAIGGMQVTPDTFKRIAKPGERIDNPEDNFRVGVRYLKTMADKFGNDPARLAAGYFSGEGNVNATGDTPYKEDRKDGNGKYVSSYVRDVLARVGNAVVPDAKAADEPKSKPIDLSGVPAYRDFIAQPKWQELNDEQRGRARGAYFDRYLASQLPEGRRTAQREAFLARAQKFEADNKQADTYDQIKTGIAEVGGAIMRSLGSGADSSDGASVDPDALTAPTDESSKIGVMGSVRAPESASTSRAPVTQEFRAEFGRAYDAATPEQRQQMAQDGGVVGQLARERMGLADSLPSGARAVVDRAQAQLTQPVPAGTIGPIQGPAPTTGSVASGLANSLYSGAVKTRAGLRAAVADAAGSREGQEAARREVAGAQLLDSTTTPAFESPTAAGIYSGAASTLQNIPAVAAAIATRNPAIATGTMVAPMLPQQYGVYREAGATPAQAGLGAAAYAASEYLTERMPMGVLVNKFGRVGATRFIADLLAKELPSEQVATLAQDAIDQAVTQPDKTWGEYLRERPGAAYQTLLATLTQSALMGGASAGVNAVNRAAERNAAEGARDQAMNKAAAFAQPLRPKHASTAAAEQVVREMAAEAGMDTADLLPAEVSAPAASAQPAQADVGAVPAAAESGATDAAPPQDTGAAMPTTPAATPQAAESPDIAAMSDAILAAEAARGEPNGSASAVPAEPVDPRGVAPDAGMGVDPAAGRAGPVSGGDDGRTGAAPAGAAGDDVVPGANGAADGQQALSDRYAQAVDVVRKSRSPSVAVIQRNLQTDYSTAAGMLAQMERDGIVTTPNERGVRSVVEQAPAEMLDAAAHEAATSPKNDLPEPTEAQKQAGNYRMGHASLHGLDITIENPRGSTRSGTDADGKAWSVEMANHYGYLKRTEGADGDHVDVFIGPKPGSAKVFVVDQIDPRTGKFDEHKVLMGFSSLAAARAGYLANYEQGWKGAGAITPMSMDQFKSWLKEGDTTKPMNPKVGKPKTEKQAKAAREARKAESAAPVATEAATPLAKPNAEHQARAERLTTRALDRASGKMPERTNTEAFKNWFRDSKVVDESGKPLVMYHGTSASQNGEAFSAFDTYASNYGLMGMGGYFTDDPAVASNYTRKGKGASPTVYAVYLSIKNPLDMEAKADPSAWAKQFEDIEQYHEGGNTNESWYRAAEESLSDGYIPAWEGAEIMQAGLRSMGYDGITHVGGGRVASDGVRHRVYIAFDPEQIKSAIGNRGTFDPARPELVFSRATRPGRMAAEDLRAKFAPIIKQWTNGPKGGVEIVQSVDDLPGNLATALRAAGDGGRGQGFYLQKSDKVYLIADNLPSLARAQEVVFHEIYGHKGMRAILDGDQYAEMMGRIRRANPKIAAAAREWFALYGDGTIERGIAGGKSNEDATRDAELLSVEEALADMASTVPVAGPVRKLLAALQAGLRKIGLHAVADWMEGKSEAETFALLRDARADVFSATSKGKTHVPAGRGAMALARKESATQWTAPESTRLDKVIYQLQDRHIDLKRVQTAIRAAGDIPEKFDAYLKEELYHGRVSARVNKFRERELRPLIEDLRVRKVSMEELEAFLWARHARERNAQIAKINPDMPDAASGLTNRQADDYMAGADVKDSAGEVVIKGLDQSKLADLKALAARVDKMVAGTRQIWLQYGLDDMDTVVAMEAAYKHYVPLKREDMDGVTSIGQGFSVKGKSTKRAMGSERKVVDILANITLAREAAITRGEKNRVALSLYGLAITSPNPEFWKVDSPPMKREINKSTGFVEKVIDGNYLNKENVLVLKVKGMDRSISFNERDERAMNMIRALKNLDGGNLDKWERMVSAATRYLAAINTQYNPVFGLTNGIRDVQAAALNLSSTPIADKTTSVLTDAPLALRAIWQAERGDESSSWAKLYREMELAGGTTGYREIFRTSQDRAKSIQKELDSHDRMIPRKALDATLDILDDYNTAIENAVRLASYKAALDKGLSQERAASIAKNITVNFNRKGAASAKIGVYYAFFNAAVQSSARMLAPIDPRTRHGKVILSSLVMGGMLQSLIGAAFMGDDWDDIPEFVKQRNFIIPAGKGYIQIPMALGYSAIFNSGRLMAEAMRGKPLGKLALDMASVLIDSANPLGSGTPLQVLSPTVLDPIVALGENKDFTGRAIFKEDQNAMRPKPGFQRAKDTASAVSKGLAYGANWMTGGTDYTPGFFSPTPDQIDYVFGAATGGVGREFNKIYQTAELMAKGKDVPEYKKPIIGRFYGDFDGDASAAAKYWQAVRDVNENRNELVGLRKEGGDVVGLLKEHPELRLARYADRTQRALTELRKTKAEIEFDPNMREAERTRRMDAIDARSKRIMEDFVAQAKKAKAGK